MKTYFPITFKLLLFIVPLVSLPVPIVGFRYMEAHQVLSVALAPGIYGCPHDAGIDFPEGDTCPHCSFWSNIKKPDLFKAVKF
ncbi:MAG: hypothetical protein K9N10_05020 [Deltaproteobacteria bacterium]|nr:hypothetical protein [Deltaproteobacteria bacterium]